MPIKIAFELSDADLEHFRGAMREAQARARRRDEGSIVAAASRLAAETAKRALPEFVRDRLARLESMLRMLEDPEWRMEGAHRARVLDALAYFAEPADLIPDQVPGVGFLDDAIMVELVVQEIGPELEAYADFCRYREEQRRSGLAPEAQRKRLEARRRAMLARIDRRRARRLRRSGSLFSISDQTIRVPGAGGGPTPGY
jgi:uncharacterized membrane protein YkvA (DUF1232 family)